MIGLPDGRVSPLLVGRDEVLALALRRWAAAGEGSGHLLLVAGESGIGKTRLLRELAARLGDDARTFSAGAFPRETDAAGAVLLTLADELQRTGLIDVADAIRVRLLDTDERVGDPARRRRMLVGDLAQILLELLTEQRTLLRVEDLHWADELSLDVLDHLASAVRHTSSVLVATYRSDELYPRSALRRWRARLLEQRLAEEARLGRLDAAETARIVEAITGELPSTEFVELLQLRSDGIPLHIEELIASGAAVPDTVTDAVTARVSELAESTRSIVDAASVIGRAFDIDILETITEESAERIDGALREAGEHHIVLARGDGALYGFRHSLICDVVYDSIPLHRRRALHAAVAAAADSVGFSRAYVSEHYERANEPAAAYSHAIAAAAEAARVSAHREAAELYRRAQRTAPADLDLESRATLHENLAFELAATDDNEGAAANLVAAMDLWRRQGLESCAAVLVPRLMAARHLLGDPLEARLQLATDAMARLNAEGGGTAQARIELLGALAAAYMLDRKLDDALDYGRRATALVTAPDELAERADIDLTLGAVLVFAGQGDEGWSLLERAIGATERLGREAETARGYRMIGSSASATVEYDRATTWIPAGLDYTERAQRWNDFHYLTAHLAHVKWAVGDWTASEQAGRRALADGRGGITTRITALIVLGYLALGRGDFAQAADQLAEALALGESMNELQRVSPALWGLAELARLRGDDALAVELCERGYHESARVSDAAYLFPYAVTGVRAILAVDGPTVAREWVDRCAAVVAGRGIPGTLPALDHANGLIQLAEGKTGRARELLERASEGWNERRRFWEGTQALIDLARCAQRSRRPAEAARLLADARERVTAAGASALLVAIASVGIDEDAETGPLTAREFEVARLVASGATNREIASALTISPKTASAHIEHILAKLGAARRAEIAAWVIGRS